MNKAGAYQKRNETRYEDLAIFVKLKTPKTPQSEHNDAQMSNDINTQSKQSATPAIESETAPAVKDFGGEAVF